MAFSYGWHSLLLWWWSVSTHQSWRQRKFHLCIDYILSIQIPRSNISFLKVKICSHSTKSSCSMEKWAESNIHHQLTTFKNKAGNINQAFLSWEYPHPEVKEQKKHQCSLGLPTTLPKPHLSLEHKLLLWVWGESRLPGSMIWLHPTISLGKVYVIKDTKKNELI